MRPSPIRILAWASILALVCAGLFYAHRASEPLSAVELPPWIPLPDTGMDASQREVRDLIEYSRWQLDSDPLRSLSAFCGREHDKPERYRMTISRDAWGDYREILVTPNGEWLEVLIRDAFPPPPEAGANAEYETIRPVKYVRIRRRDAEPIRRAWNTRALWHAAQGTMICMDGPTVVLEACVAGRYAIRRRACEAEAFEPAQQLWEAVTTLLPAPERGTQKSKAAK
jgi:hypothetical protein